MLSHSSVACVQAKGPHTQLNMHGPRPVVSPLPLLCPAQGGCCEGLVCFDGHLLILSPGSLREQNPSSSGHTLRKTVPSHDTGYVQSGEGSVAPLVESRAEVKGGRARGREDKESSLLFLTLVPPSWSILQAAERHSSTSSVTQRAELP